MTDININCVKKRVFKELKWEHKCSLCKRTECLWDMTGKTEPIPLDLDHIIQNYFLIQHLYFISLNLTFPYPVDL